METIKNSSIFHPLFTPEDRFVKKDSPVLSNLLNQFTGKCQPYVPSKNERSLTFHPVVFVIYIMSLVALFSFIRLFDDKNKEFSSYKHKSVLQVTESLWNMVLLAIIPFVFCNFSRTFNPLTIVGMFLGAFFMRIINHFFAGYNAGTVWSVKGLNKVMWVLGGVILFVFYVTVILFQTVDPKLILFRNICLGLLLLLVAIYIVIGSVYKDKTQPLGLGLGLGVLGVMSITYTLWVQYKECKIPRSLMMIFFIFLWFITMIIIRKTSKDESDKNATIHVHHYQIGYFGMFITSGSTQLSALINGFMIGLFVDGISSWGADSTIEQ
jgi:hypothetical protein